MVNDYFIVCVCKSLFFQLLVSIWVSLFGIFSYVEKLSEGTGDFNVIKWISTRTFSPAAFCAGCRRRALQGFG